MPGLKLERELYNSGSQIIAGIDEAGRGPLAGPVVAVSVNWGDNPLIEGVKDSKKISEKKRLKLFNAIIENALDIGVGIVHEDKIDEMTNEFINYYSNNISNESTLKKGLLNFLSWCKDKSIQLGVCTNKQEYLSIDLLKKIKIYHFFEYVAGGDTFKHNKPDPRHCTNVLQWVAINRDKIRDVSLRDLSQKGYPAPPITRKPMLHTIYRAQYQLVGARGLILTNQHM